MIGILIGAVGACVAGGFWIFTASFVYCRLSGHMALFVFPFDQWLDIAPYWTVTGWTKAYVVISAAAACLPFVVAYIVATRWRKQGWRLPIYGKTGWANRTHMKVGGISSDKSPL